MIATSHSARVSEKGETNPMAGSWLRGRARCCWPESSCKPVAWRPQGPGTCLGDHQHLCWWHQAGRRAGHLTAELPVCKTWTVGTAEFHGGKAPPSLQGAALREHQEPWWAKGCHGPALCPCGQKASGILGCIEKSSASRSRGFSSFPQPGWGHLWGAVTSSGLPRTRKAGNAWDSPVQGCGGHRGLELPQRPGGLGLSSLERGGLRGPPQHLSRAQRAGAVWQEQGQGTNTGNLPGEKENSAVKVTGHWTGWPERPWGVLTWRYSKLTWTCSRWGERMDQRISRGAFHPQPFCDSVKGKERCQRGEMR